MNGRRAKTFRHVTNTLTVGQSATVSKLICRRTRKTYYRENQHTSKELTRLEADLRIDRQARHQQHVTIQCDG